MTKLKPCPFCGGEARIMLEEEDRPDDSFHNVYCTGCGAQFWVKAKNEAITAWNRRTQPNEPLTLEELKREKYVWLEPLKDWARVTGYGLIYFGNTNFTTWGECGDLGRLWFAYRRPPEKEK